MRNHLSFLSIFVSTLFALGAFPVSAQSVVIFPSGDDALDAAVRSGVEKSGLSLFEEGGSTFFSALLSEGVKCADDDCRAEMAGAFGADIVVHASALAGSLVASSHETDPQELLETVTLKTDATIEQASLATRYVLASLIANAGEGTLSVNGKGADVMLDGTLVAVLPLANYATAAGVHLLTVNGESQLVEVNADALSVVEIKTAQGGGKGLAWGAIAGGATLVVASAGALTYSFFEAQRINQEIREGNANGDFDGEDDPDTKRVNREKLITHSITGVGIFGALSGLVLTAVGTTLLLSGD